MTQERPNLFEILVTEEELYALGNSYKWSLPRKPFRREGFSAKRSFKNVKVFPVSERWEDWMLAEFEFSTTPKKGSEIQFYNVKAVYGFSELHVNCLKDRYEEFGLEIKMASENTCSAFRVWWNQQRENTILCDVDDGIKAIFEMVELGEKIDAGFSAREIAHAIFQNEISAGDDNFLSLLFHYSRLQCFHTAGIIAALCDLGVILRQRQETGNDGEHVGALAQSVKALMNQENQFDPYVELQNILTPYASYEEYKIEYVLFLKWKFDSEQQGGRVDFKQVLDDVANLFRIGVSKEKISNALLLFGGYAGFASFSVQYHLFKRGHN